MLTHTHTHSHTHAHAHAHAHSIMHTNTHSQSRTHAQTHILVHTRHLCIHVSIDLSIHLSSSDYMYVSILPSILRSVHLSIYSLFHLSIYPPTLHIYRSIRCCNDARLRCNTVCIAAAPRCDGMLHWARRHRATAPASSSPSHPIAECSRVPLSTLRSSRPPSASPCVRESAAARRTPVQQREPERAALRPTRPT